MRYKVNIKFKDNTKLDTEADGYSMQGCAFQLYIHGTNAKIKLFPLLDITEINLEDRGL